MEPFNQPQRTESSPGRGPGAALAIAALIVVMVALSIAGSAYWRPAARSRNTLELGGARPVGNNAPAASETISSVLDMVAPTVAFLTIPDLARSGSGVVVHEAGFVVTNAHVVEGTEELLVAFDNGEEYDAVVYGVDRATDLAVVKVNADGPLPVAPLGDSNALRVGEFVLALGAPFGLEATATSGIVSGLHRSGLGIARFEDFIITDAPINRGNSGGPLVNLRGEVVGINTAIIADEEDRRGGGGTFAGVGFAIPVNVMRVVAQRLIGDGGLALPQGRGGGNDDGAASDAIGSSGNAAAEASAARRAGAAVPVALPNSRVADQPLGRLAGQTAKPTPGPVTSHESAVGYVEARDDRGREINHGTGFVISVGGSTLFVTNEHVVRGAARVTVFFNVGADGAALAQPAQVLIADDRRDLALLDLPGDARLSSLVLGNADEVVVGAGVTAVGARRSGTEIAVLDNRGSITELDVRLSGVASQARLLATNVPIEVGDSGGPLIDRSGNVVGVMLARDIGETATAGGERRSYAVSLHADEEIGILLDDAARPDVDLGFETLFPYDDRAMVLVFSVEPEGLAARFGLQQRDRIVAIDGQPLTADPVRQRAMLAEFQRLPPGSQIELTIERDTEGGQTETYTIAWSVPLRTPVP